MTAIPPCLAVDELGRPSFPLRFAEGADAVVARCIVRLRTVVGSWLSDGDFGCVDLADVIESGGRYSDVGFRLAVKEQLSEVVGVVAVGRVTGPASGMQVQIRIRTADGVEDVLIGRNPYAAGDTMAWYVLSGAFGGPIQEG